LNVPVQIGTTIFLARLLSPRDYGLVAIVFALMSFAPMLIDLGTTDAIVQKKRITHAEVSTLFWLKFAVAVLLSLCVAWGSWFLAAIYAEPALADIVVVLSLTLIITALSVQHFALMRRAMHFKRIAIIEISSNLVSSVAAIAMVFTGWGYWGLVL